MARRKTSGSSARRWHRGIGVGASLFIVFLVATGLTLNHAHQLGLDRQHIAPAWLLDWYGMSEPESLRSFSVNGHWLTFAGSQLYLDGRPATVATGGVGAVSSGDWLVAAGKDELLLLNGAGELIERLRPELAGTGIVDAIGSDTNGTVVVKSGSRIWVADSDLLDWVERQRPPAAIQWSSPSDEPAHVRQAIVRHYNGGGLSLERLLLDLHSGRIFGRFGVLIYDLLALVLGFSAVSGLLLWWRTRKNGQNGRSR